jgi:hypothetical protein
MTWSDPIVDEVRRIRDAHAAKFNYDLKAIFLDIKEQEKRSGRTYVSFAPARVEPTESPHLTGPATPVTDSIPSQQADSTATV